MKKITFFFFLLAVSLGYSQTNLEDFESLPAEDFNNFSGLGGSNIVANPDSSTAPYDSATVGELIVVDAGDPWQGANLVMQDNYIDATTPASQPVTVDVYSTSAFTLLGKLDGGVAGAVASAADANHTGSGWETLTFTFNESLDSTAPANGEYTLIAFFPNWNGGGFHDPEIERTIYIDNVVGFAGAPVPVAVDVLEDFESLPAEDFNNFSGLGGSNIVANPDSSTAPYNSPTVGEMIVVDAGDPWQGANLVMQENYIDATTPASQPVTVDVYSTSAFTLLGKLDGGVGGAVPSAADAEHTGSGWETLTFTFDESLDSTAPANGEYTLIAFFPNWNGSGYHDPEIERTVYIDNVTGVRGAAVAPDPDPEAAPLPISPNGETYNIYNDTNGYTTNFPFAYPFGEAALVGTPDLDPSAEVNQAFKINLGVSGYGQGEETTTGAINAYDFVSFDYWINTPTSINATGTGFRFYLISDNTDPVTEVFYEIGTDEAAVTETWTRVSIPMTFFTGNGFDQAEFFQWKVEPFGQSVDNNSLLYLDNILFTGADQLSIDEFESTSFRAFPNPTNGNWTISGNSIVNSVSVFDLLGKKVLDIKPDSNEFVVNATSLKTGVYFAKLEGVNGSKTMKLVKQ